MRLSDIRRDSTLEVIAGISHPIANVAEDAEASALFKREKLPDGVTAKKFLLKRIRKSLPVLLKGHKADIIEILSAIEGVSADEYAGALNLVKLVKDCTDLLTDEVFMELFISAQSENNSGSARESIEAHEQ